jgi:uncharacterized protein YodC (DUF2158 family)
MDTQDFKPGDIVHLPSGGPRMSVVSSDAKITKVIWFSHDHQEVRSAEIPTALLEPLK